jgi:hypothetical protein
VAAVLSAQLSADSVRKVVDLLDTNETSTISERLEHLYRPKKKPYLARVDGLGTVVYGGHEPMLYARLVRKLRVVSHDEDGEAIAWEERRPGDMNRAARDFEKGETQVIEAPWFERKLKVPFSWL